MLETRYIGGDGGDRLLLALASLCGSDGCWGGY